MGKRAADGGGIKKMRSVELDPPERVATREVRALL